MTSRRFVLVLALASLGAGPPEVAHLFPAGGGRGQAVEVTAGGKFARWPVRAWVDEPGVVFEPKDKPGQFLARIAADAPPGVRLVRFFDDSGASGLRPFVVGHLPETMEAEPNDEPSKAQAVDSLPVVINGRLGKRGDSDAFRIALRKGQSLIANLDGRRLGSPMDGVLQLSTPDGLVLAQADDNPAPDPVLTANAPADGDYLVRVFAFPETPDSSIAFAGGDAFIYRLTLTTGGQLQHALPLAVAAGGPATVEPIGPGVPLNLGRLRIEPTSRLEFARAWHPSLAGVLRLPIVPHPSLVESKPADDAPQAVPLPASVSGRIEAGGTGDRYRVALRKGQACRFRVAARALGSPLDPVLAVADDTGKALAEQDDTGGRDAELTFTAPADGDYTVTVRDLNAQGGPEFVYRLDLLDARPDFALTLKSDRVVVAPGQTARFTVNVARRDGHAAPIAVDLLNLPPGLTARPATSEPKGDSAKAVTLELAAAHDAPPFAGPIAVVGRSAELERLARADVLGLDESDQPWLTVTPIGAP